MCDILTDNEIWHGCRYHCWGVQHHSFSFINIHYNRDQPSTSAMLLLICIALLATSVSAMPVYIILGVVHNASYSPVFPVCIYTNNFFKWLRMIPVEISNDCPSIVTWKDIDIAWRV